MKNCYFFRTVTNTSDNSLWVQGKRKTHLIIHPNIIMNGKHEIVRVRDMDFRTYFYPADNCKHIQDKREDWQK